MTVLPDKHIRLSSSLLYAGAVLLDMMDTDHTVSELWDKTRAGGKIKTFDRFVGGLDLLFILGAVRLDGDRVAREAGLGGRRRPAAAGLAERGTTGAPAH